MHCCTLWLDLAVALVNVDILLLQGHVQGLTLMVEGMDGKPNFGTDVNVESILGPAI